MRPICKEEPHIHVVVPVSAAGTVPNRVRDERQPEGRVLEVLDPRLHIDVPEEAVVAIVVAIIITVFTVDVVDDGLR